MNPPLVNVRKPGESPPPKREDQVQQEQPASSAKTDKKQLLQDLFLNTVRVEHIWTSVYLANGVKLQGRIVSFDMYTLLLEDDKKGSSKTTQMVYKSGISTIVPSKQVEIRYAAPLPESIQDQYLTTLREADQLEVKVYLVNGIKLEGQIEAFDQHVLLLGGSRPTQMVFKHAITSVEPKEVVSFSFEGGQNHFTVRRS